ncbi:MAG: hypothetical protein EAZ24_07315 [Burkholderiales bacterium]|nr:MAG: hypothetical protein EAZ24_07315 [Burkholderiales bacterium]TAG78472.1 MAG: hypothetical protein EAZ21_12685 [Betaproteobacteria bacterium]
MNEKSAAHEWLTQNARALDQHRQRVEQHGTFGDRLRSWKRKQLEDAAASKQIGTDDE